MKKVLILGGVAAGTKTAAKLKRLRRNEYDVTILTKDKDISYAGCGLPYYVGGAIEELDSLIVNTPEKYTRLTGAQVLTGWEAIAVDPAAKKVRARTENGEEQDFPYDELVITTGASAVLPPIPGMDKKGIFKLRTPEDAAGIRTYIQTTKAAKALVIGAGFIGLETAENLLAQGLSVTVVEAAPQILPHVFDPEMAAYVQRQLQKKGLQILTGVKASSVLGDATATGLQTEMGPLQGDILIASAGIRPNTAFLKDLGLEMTKGTLLVNEHLQTSLPDIYAAGDCAMVTNRLTKAPQWSPMGSSANLEGRTLAHVLIGIPAVYPGVLGTSVIKLPGLNCARTGLTEAAAREAGYDVITVTTVNDDKAHYYPGAGNFITKLIADKSTHALLGLQTIGAGAVDKMADIAVTAISLQAKIENLDCLDLCYAPPFSTAIHPFVQSIQILENKLHGGMQSFSPAEFQAGAAKDYEVINAAPPQALPWARRIDFTTVNGPLPDIPLDAKLLLVCIKGKNAYLLQNRLKAYGYTNTRVLEAGQTMSQLKPVFRDGIPADEIKRVKGLGFLRDKTTPDCFNARVITRNGKITTAESQAIAKAAELYGSGEITMTTRLTVEIQRVPYSNIDALRSFLQQAGLETGGTGSKVRPVVSCKGTTCQYGLIDTFQLAAEIHERFYKGYHEVQLPHKFKIAVGGCPNNCVKPVLNDIGIVGQRVPQLDLEKCRSCGLCQPAKACPIQIIHQDGRTKPQLDLTACNHCGRCIGTCPFHVFDQSVDGYRIYIGGRWGKKIQHGQPLDTIFTSKEEVLAIVEKAILFFRAQGITGERFADTIARIGFAEVQHQLLSDELLKDKENNLAAQKHLVGGATC